jgi:hypothetical protein
MAKEMTRTHDEHVVAMAVQVAANVAKSRKVFDEEQFVQLARAAYRGKAEEKAETK